MSFLNPEPVDPRYAAFRDGWDTWIVDKAQYPGLRWKPFVAGGVQGGWTAYKIAEWDFIDFGVTGPKSPLEAHWVFGSRPGYVWKWDDFWRERELPKLWTEVERVFNQYKRARPSAVWNPYDGSWREMRRRPVAGPNIEVPGEVPGTRPKQTELERRLDELLELYRADKITDQQLKDRTMELLREYG